MATLNADSPVSDIHICGRCRAEFSDIYEFVDHKRHCSTTRNCQDAVNSNTTHQERAMVTDHVVSDNTSSHGLLVIQPKCQPQDESVRILPHTQSEQSFYSHERNVYSYPQDQQQQQQQQQQEANVALNLCYNEDVNQHGISSYPQYQTTADSSAVAKQDLPRVEYVYEVPAISQHSSSSYVISDTYTATSNSTSLPIVLTATSQELLTCTAGNGGIPALSDNTVDNSALCPEDLEVGQISEAMMGEMHEKFGSKGSGFGLSNRKLKDSSGKRVGRLDPISTFTLRKKCNKMSSTSTTSTTKSIARTLPFMSNRMNSSSAPLSADCEDESPVNHRLDLKAVTFEKRERLQGVSDDLLNQSPSDSAKRLPTQNETGKASIQFQNVVGSLSSSSSSSDPHRHKAYFPENPPKQPSVYKAIFTSPSSGGHRLSSVPFADGDRISEAVKEPHLLSRTLDYEKQDANIIRLEDENNCSINYTNISKLAAESSDDNKTEKVVSNGVVFERSGALLVPDSSLSHVRGSKPNVMECVETEMPLNENVVKEYSVSAQNVIPFTVKIPEQMYPNPVGGENCNAGSMNYSSMTMPVARACNNVGENNNVVLTTMKEQNNITRNAGSFIAATEYSAWEAEEIQVIASTDQLNTYMNVSGGAAGDENKEVEVCLKNDSFQVDRDHDTMIFVYKREDGSLIMMCKPDASASSSSNTNTNNNDRVEVNNTSIDNAMWQTVIESVVGDGTVAAIAAATAQDQQQQVLALPQPPQPPQPPPQESNLPLPYKMKQTTTATSSSTTSQDHGKTMHGKTKTKVSSPLGKEKSVRKIAIKSSHDRGAAVTSNNVSCNDVSDVQRSVRGSGSNKIFTCHFGNCNYTTKMDKDFQRHYRTHTGERPYKCGRCDLAFTRSDKLKTHLRCHEGQKPFQCKLCNYATTDNSSLKKHMRIHTDERPFKCQICPYASRNSSQLIVHLRIHTGDAPFHCGQCTAQFKINSDLKRHLRTHTGEKPYACDKCDYRCTNNSNLKVHYKINHSLENEKKCPKCSFATSSMKRLREHVKIHDEARIVKCSACQYTCSSTTALRSHMMVHNTLRPFRCTFCPYSSKQSGNLKKHIQNVHNDKQHRQTGLTSSSKSSTRSLSVKGPSSSSSSSLSSSHDKSHHGSVSKRRHQSKDNPPTSLSSKATDRHQPRSLRRPSTSRKVHVCPLCGSGFVRHDSLKCHLKQHGEKEIPSSKDSPKLTGNVTATARKLYRSSVTNDEQSSHTSAAVSSSRKPIAPPPPPPPQASPTLQQTLLPPPPSQQSQLTPPPPPSLPQLPPPPPQTQLPMLTLLPTTSQLYTQQQLEPTPTSTLQQQNSYSPQTPPRPHPHQSHPAPPPPPPPPPPLTPYRSKGLDSIVAAASQLYREQYMNGKEDDDDEIMSGGLSTNISSIATTYDSANPDMDSSSLVSISSQQQHQQQQQQPLSHCSSGFYDGKEYNTTSSSIPIVSPPDSVVSQHQRRSSYRSDNKRQFSGTRSSETPSKKSRNRRGSSASKDAKQQQHYHLQGRVVNISTKNATNNNMSASNNSSGPVPWEHSSYTLSPQQPTTELHNYTPSSSSSLSSSTTKVIKSPRKLKPKQQHHSSSSSPSVSSKLSTISSLSQYHDNQKPHRTANRSGDSSSSQILIQALTPPSQQSQNTTTAAAAAAATYQYLEAPAPNVNPAHLQSQPISIQLVPPPPMHHSQSPSQAQNIVGNISFQQQQNQHRQQQPSSGSSQQTTAATALQILLPAGMQMTQIIQQQPLPPPPQSSQSQQQQQQQQQLLLQQQQPPPPPPPSIVVAAAPATGGMDITLQQQQQQQLQPQQHQLQQQQHHQVVGQPHIVFQVQEAPSIPAAPRQDMVSIPGSMAAEQQVMLGGQCPTYAGVSQSSHVISSPADSTTMGCVYAVMTTDQQQQQQQQQQQLIQQQQRQ